MAAVKQDFRSSAAS